MSEVNYKYRRNKNITSGFIYIWHDVKNNRFYIGRHWGTLDDGYICSSDWMRKSYRRRPQDFKRRILKIIVAESESENDLDRAKEMLKNEEQRWLDMIKSDEIKKGSQSRYYNINTIAFDHWNDTAESRLSLKEKLSRANKGQIKPPRTEEHKLNLSLSQKGKPRRKHTEEHKKMMSEKMKGKPQNKSDSWRENIIRSNKENKTGKPGHKWSEEEKKMLSDKQKGRPKNPESIAKMKATKRRQFLEKQINAI